MFNAHGPSIARFRNPYTIRDWCKRGNWHFIHLCSLAVRIDINGSATYSVPNAVIQNDCQKRQFKGFSDLVSDIGRLRPKEVDSKTTLEGGEVIEGLDGLRDYLLKQRREDVVRQFCRKLLGYALGREVQLSDEPLLSEMQQKLASGDYRFSVAVESIVTSDQFRKIRGAEHAK